MEYSTRAYAIGELVDVLARRTPHTGWRGIRHLLDADEVEEAMDVLVANLVRDSIPITEAQHGRIRELMNVFELDAQNRSIYRYLGDPEMLDRMTVVDEPSA